MLSPAGVGLGWGRGGAGGGVNLVGSNKPPVQPARSSCRDLVIESHAAPKMSGIAHKDVMMSGNAARSRSESQFFVIIGYAIIPRKVGPV